MSYRFAVDKRALGQVLALPGANQWQLYDCFEAIALHPFREPDLQLKGSGLAPISIRVFGDILVHYHVDHATKRVLVVDFEIVDDTG